MKTIIAGSRNINDFETVTQAVQESKFDITEIVSGCAKGVDTVAIHYASRFGFSVKKFPADWDRYGKPAGYIRNAEMAKYADALIAIWDGRSKGTANMIEQAKKNNLKTFIKVIKNER